MNNNFFAITRYFRDLGVDAHLFLIPQSGHKHFLPENDTHEDISNAEWIKIFPVNYRPLTYLLPLTQEKLKTLAEYDRVVACGPAVGLLGRAGIQVDLFIPYGSDLINFPFKSKEEFSYNFFLLLPYLIISFWRQRNQFNGIKKAKITISNANWEAAKAAIEEIGVFSKNLPRLMIYKEQIPTSVFEQFRFLDQHDFIVFSPTRHLWKTNAEPLPDFDRYGGAKRNDKLIRAFAKLVEEKLFSKPLLLFCEFGADVGFSKLLIEELGIGKYTKWLPLMPRKQLVACISRVTFVADQFREGISATSAGTTNEALAYGTPVITNTNGAIHDKMDPYYDAPILDAITEDQIFGYFLDYSKNPKKYVNIGIKSQQWFEENLGMGLAKKYLSLLGSDV